MPASLSERCNVMNETEIRNYAELMRELGLTGLEITENPYRIRLERVPGGPEDQGKLPASPVGTAAQTGPAAGEFIVKSPVVGVFYAAPAENASPYVTVGDTVKKGQTLCVIEAMKLMNEISAEEDGEIVEVCAANGQITEYGTELFRIRRLQ